MRTKRFDRERFVLVLDYLRTGKDLTWRQVCRQAGVTPSTVTRMKQGRGPDVDGLVLLAAWANVDLRVFLKKEGDDE